MSFTPDAPGRATDAAPSIAIVGAGPVGLAFALMAQQAMPQARLCLFDARALDADLHRDTRTLALGLGSVQLLQRLQAWPAAQAAAITEISVSQVPPGRADVRLRAADLAVPQLGAVLGYGSLLEALQNAWVAAQRAQSTRLRHQFGLRVAGIKPLTQAVELDAGVVETFDLVVLAEGGLFAEQASKPLRRNYAQTAWVGDVRLGPGVPRGLAVERFTRSGPLALLPLPDDPEGRRATLVWCVDAHDDPVAPLHDEQRLTLLRSLFPPDAADLRAIGPLKGFPLGLNAERHLVNSRVVAIGNAAQTLHPVAGQGLNLGLRDAHTLAQCLRTAYRSADIDAALSRFTRQRAPDRTALLATTDVFARAFAWDHPGATLAREAALGLLSAVKPLRDALARQMMFGWR